MSTFPVDSDDDRSGHVALSYGAAKDEGLLRILSSIPDFTFPDATSHPVDRERDTQARPAAATLSPLHPLPLTEQDGAAASDIKRSQQSGDVPPVQWQFQQPSGNNEAPSRALISANVSVGCFDPATPAPRLGRLGHALTHTVKWVVAGAIAVPIAGSVVVEIGHLVGDSQLPNLLQSASPPLPLPPTAPLSELAGAMTEREAEPGTRAVVTLQPAVSPQPTPSETPPTESMIGASPQTASGSEYEKSVRNKAAMPEPPAIARPESMPTEASGSPSTTTSASPIAKLAPAPMTAREPPSIATSGSIPLAKLEPTSGSTAINRVPPRLGKLVVADHAGFQFADSSVRYLTRAELQKLSADQLYMARNEIFARKGRYFKDDTLHAHFSQFPWYRPHAWEVPLSPVEQANVGLIQSIEAPATASRTITVPLAAQANVEDGVAFTGPTRRYLTPEELRGLSTNQLMVVRNEIFARRGRYFKDGALRAYFSQFPWYQPHAWDVPLSPVDQANVRLVQSIEQAASPPRQALRTWQGLPM